MGVAKSVAIIVKIVKSVVLSDTKSVVLIAAMILAAEWRIFK